MKKAEISECGVLFPRYSMSDPEDVTGCMRPQGHFNGHLFKSTDGRMIEWEEDTECTCGCWDEEDGTCLLYREITEAV